MKYWRWMQGVGSIYFELLLGLNICSQAEASDARSTCFRMYVSNGSHNFYVRPLFHNSLNQT